MVDFGVMHPKSLKVEVIIIFKSSHRPTLKRFKNVVNNIIVIKIADVVKSLMFTSPRRVMPL